LIASLIVQFKVQFKINGGAGIGTHMVASRNLNYSENRDESCFFPANTI